MDEMEIALIRVQWLQIAIAFIDCERATNAPTCVVT
jgi:hypothetical protein